ncbi:MAG: hypothetical protein V3V31_11785 [Methylococcales bacterium]
MKSVSTLINTTLFGLSIICSSVAVAVEKLEDNSKLIGKWVLEEVAPRSLGGERIPEDRIWEFTKDGKMSSSGYNRILKKNTTQEMTYEIKDGNIVSPVPGRTNKVDTYSVYEIKEDSMILMRGVNTGFYIFRRK